MRMLILGVLIAMSAWAQSDVSPEVLLLAKIKVRAAENLQRLPNYTCLETIERTFRRATNRRFVLLDVLRMEVGLVNRKEVFAWPGSKNFEDKEITDMVGNGAISNGSFALHARSLFLGNGPSFQHVGEVIRDGRKLQRFGYDVPLLHSGYSLRIRPNKAIIGYKGSFWVDAESLDLVRMEIISTQIPPNLPVSSVRESLEYKLERIGEENFLLPHSSEIIIEDLQGNESRNQLKFTRCRQFLGESVVKFEEAPDTEVAAKKAPVKVTLIDDVDIELKLEDTIQSGETAVGDEVTFVVAKDAKRKGQIVLPKGARVSGRILRYERQETANIVEWALHLDLQKFEFENQYGEFRARLAPWAQSSITRTRESKGIAGYVVRQETPPDNPRIGILYLRGESGRLPAGTRLTWRTEKSSEAIQ